MLFVSKPIDPPWTDGSKNLVRDVANALTRTQAQVLTADRVATCDRFAAEGVKIGVTRVGLSRWMRRAPMQAQVAAAVIGVQTDVLNFVHAPTPSNVRATRAIAQLHSFRSKTPVRTIQTVASRPLVFDPALLFADRVIVASQWQRDQWLQAGARCTIDVVPPCTDLMMGSPREEIAALRASWGAMPGDRVVVYPGDLEFSDGARVFVEAAKLFAARAGKDDRTKFVLACRKKTARAAELESQLRALVDPSRVLFVGETNMRLLLSSTDLLSFAVDTLFGKVDLPLVLLEALSLRRPMIVSNMGPLAEIASAEKVRASDPAALANAIHACLADPEKMRALGEAGGTEYFARFIPSRYAERLEQILDELFQG